MLIVVVGTDEESNVNLMMKMRREGELDVEIAVWCVSEVGW